MKTVRDLQEFLKNKNPDAPLFIWQGEMVPPYCIDGFEHAEADPTGAFNEDSIPMPEAILFSFDTKDWAGKGVEAYYEDEPVSEGSNL